MYSFANTGLFSDSKIISVKMITENVHAVEEIIAVCGVTQKPLPLTNGGMENEL